jgi:hypothetical protein
MQLVLSNNRIIAHGENFLSMGGVVINTETGARYENATVAECDGCPSDIDKVGYEYHAGVFVPCAPYGVGNNNGYFMEVCADCATPRSSGIPIKGGISYSNLNADLKSRLDSSLISLLWSNAYPTEHFDPQTVTLASTDWDFLIIESIGCASVIVGSGNVKLLGFTNEFGTIGWCLKFREATVTNKWSVTFGEGKYYAVNSNSINDLDYVCVPSKIYGVKL